MTDECIYLQARLAAVKQAVKQCTARVKQCMRSSNENFLATTESELAEVAKDMLRHARISQLFDILIRFPHSTPALSDLRDVLRTTEHKEDVWLDLSLSLQDRLLHPGAPTAQVVQLYVYLIRGLRIVDSSGLILSHVIGEVRRYLRARPDTINVLISALLGTDERFAMLREDMGLGESGQTNEDDDNSQLIPHVSRAPAKDALVGATLAASALNQMPKNWSDPNWEPRPINAGPDYRLGTSYDVVQMLVGIFEDRSRFVNALEVSTAKGLLDVKGYDTVKQLETNLILKRRFGDVLLSRCDTMLDDVVNSKRTDSNIHANILPPVASRDHFGRLMPNPSPRTSSFSEPVEPTTHVTHPLIYSRQFWPDLERGPQSVTMGSAQQGNDSQVPHIPLPPSGLSLLTFPPESALGKSLETYGAAYKKAKTMRKVQWLNSRATVDLSLEMDDGRRIEIEAVDVLYAATIEWVASLAGTSTALTLSNLGLALGVDHAAAEKAVRFWCDRCILREGRDAGEISEDTFVVVEKVDASEEGANV
ncbi:Anaphase-promoting complex (APC), subunit 2 [Ceraceosorus bombacis]|uniref:Anaphase-promoting complex (APC), subunit 2 n=1 Tax=Ceraceosorus bombacis TaxID=401625 RepID=A0A0P1BBN3_9BASI|nr:Anaphase-promoting complex (APC), subunit 2 [Ceraceosorus bombacis]